MNSHLTETRFSRASETAPANVAGATSGAWPSTVRSSSGTARRHSSSSPPPPPPGHAWPSAAMTDPDEALGLWSVSLLPERVRITPSSAERWILWGEDSSQWFGDWLANRECCAVSSCGRGPRHVDILIKYLSLYIIVNFFTNKRQHDALYLLLLNAVSLDRRFRSSFSWFICLALKCRSRTEDRVWLANQRRRCFF